MRTLDQAYDSQIASDLLEALEESGYSAVESIPGLVMAITLLAEKTIDPARTIDEATDLLQDGPDYD